MSREAAASVAVRAATAVVSGDAAPRMLSHLAMITKDANETTRFYTEIMRMPLVAAVAHERLPSAGEIMPYIHIFFRMQDGSTLAFFEAVDLPDREPAPHVGYSLFNHLALEVDTVAEVDEWKEWLVGKGIDVLGPIDHTIIYSIYFYDPNGIRLEITTPLVHDWNDRGEKARSVVDQWGETKARAVAEGRQVGEALRQLINDVEPTTFD